MPEMTVFELMFWHDKCGLSLIINDGNVVDVVIEDYAHEEIRDKQKESAITG